MGLHLLDLPVDLLYLMLRPLLVSRERIQLCPCAGPPVDVRPLAVLLTHPTVHAVACPLLYEANVFALDVRGEHGPHVRRCLGDAAAAGAAEPGTDDEEPGAGLHRGPSPLLLQRSALRRMSTVELRVGRLRAWVDWHVVPLLSDMALGGALAALDVYVSAPGDQHAPPTADVLARPPLPGLLRVLGDPYLRRARLLWVSGGGADEDPEEAAAEVDWREMLREADPEGRHRVVGFGQDVRAVRGGG